MELRSLKKNKNKEAKLNLIPILDSVFIFIFFLLMSAQFIDIYEIGSDAPAVSTTQSLDKKPPLNLTLDITNGQIQVKTGLNEKTVKTVGKNEEDFDLKSLKEFLISLKKEHITEKSIILRPAADVDYAQIVKIMDAIRSIKKSETPIVAENKEGQVVKTWDLFNNIIFETII